MQSCKVVRVPETDPQTIGKGGHTLEDRLIGRLRFAQTYVRIHGFYLSWPWMTVNRLGDPLPRWRVLYSMQLSAIQFLLKAPKYRRCHFSKTFRFIYDVLIQKSLSVSHIQSRVKNLTFAAFKYWRPSIAMRKRNTAITNGPLFNSLCATRRFAPSWRTNGRPALS